jgi:iron complex outermembrane receptor protein
VPSTAIIGALPPVYAGGQVATGGSLGLLGNRSVMDTPFSQTSYTAQTIQNQQARTVGDVVANDPSVRLVSTGGSGLDVFLIRGFYYDSGDLGLNGLYGLAPYYSTAVNFVERVEVLKGPSALLNGMPPAGAIGGSINLITKRAPDVPITQVTATYQSQSQFGTLVDLARRYGERKEFGVRFNGSYHSGKTDYDGQSDMFGNAVLNMDYRGERVRLSVDMGYQSDDLWRPQRFMAIAPTTFVPPPPKAGSMYGVPWSYWRPTDKFAMIQGEVDLANNVTAYGSFGWHDSFISFRYASPTVTNIGAVGNWQAAPFLGVNSFETLAGQGGIRATADIGAVTHTLDVNYSRTDRARGDSSFGRLPAGVVISNLYNPIVANLALPNFGTPVQIQTGDTHLKSVGVADTMSILDGRVQLIVGSRRQTVGVSTTDLLNPRNSSAVEAATWSPGYALVVRPLKNITLYANYIEGLQAGTVVPFNFLNAGAIFPPYHTKQKEAGIKVDFGRVTTTVAAFEITRPSLITVGTLPNAVQLPNGEQRNRGVEINTFGELTPAVRVLGGVTFIDARLTRTAGGMNDGKKGQGVGDVNLNMGAEWDTWFIPGFTVSGRVIYTSDQFLNAANTQSIPDWTRLDLGARYTFSAPWNGKPIVVRFNVENVLNKTYYAGSYTSDGIVTLGAPRTFLASTTFNF